MIALVLILGATLVVKYSSKENPKKMYSNGF